MLNNPNGQNPVDPMAGATNDPMAAAPGSNLADQGMVTDILDLDQNAAAPANTPAAAETQMPSANVGPTMPETVQPAMPQQNPMGPAPTVNNAPAAVDMFDGIPSLSTEENPAAAPQIPNGNQLPSRPEKKMSIMGILLVAIIIIVLLGGVLFAYNFWRSSTESTDDASLEETEMTMESEEGSYDFVEDDGMMETLPVAEEVLMEESETVGLTAEEMQGEIVLPPLSGDVLDYEEFNDDMTVDMENDMEGEMPVLPEDMPVDETLMPENEELDNMMELIEEGSMTVEPEELNLDLDNDGLTNAEEGDLGTNPYKADSDNDGLNDREEIMVYFTDPLNSDSDGDSYLDGQEVAAGYNPNGEGTLIE